MSDKLALLYIFLFVVVSVFDFKLIGKRTIVVIALSLFCGMYPLLGASNFENIGIGIFFIPILILLHGFPFLLIFSALALFKQDLPKAIPFICLMAGVIVFATTTYQVESTRKDKVEVMVFWRTVIDSDLTILPLEIYKEYLPERNTNHRASSLYLSDCDDTIGYELKEILYEIGLGSVLPNCKILPDSIINNLSEVEKKYRSEDTCNAEIAEYENPVNKKIPLMGLPSAEIYKALDEHLRNEATPGDWLTKNTSIVEAALALSKSGDFGKRILDIIQENGIGYGDLPRSVNKDIFLLNHDIKALHFYLFGPIFSRFKGQYDSFDREHFLEERKKFLSQLDKKYQIAILEVFEGWADDFQPDGQISPFLSVLCKSNHKEVSERSFKLFKLLVSKHMILKKYSELIDYTRLRTS